MAQTFPVSSNFQNGEMAAYLASVNAQPILTAEEEHELAVRYHEHEDLDAARQLVLSHLRFVVRVARGFVGYGIPLGDLVQEGNVGLMKAVKRFEPNRNVRLVSYAVHWIKAEIYDFILRNWKIVRISTTKAHKKLFFNLRKYRASLDGMSDKEIKDLSNQLDVPEETVREMEVRLNGTSVSFDANVDDNDRDDASFVPSTYLGDMQFNPEQVYEQDWAETSRSQLIETALDSLDARSKDIIVQRWLSEKKTTLSVLAKKYDLSAERIRQLEQKALLKMRKIMTDAGTTIGDLSIQ